MDINNYTDELIIKFVANLNGKYRDHVSDIMLIQLLSWEFRRVYLQVAKLNLDTPRPVRLEVTAIEVGHRIFRSMLDYACGIPNGDSITNEFAALFRM